MITNLTIRIIAVFVLILTVTSAVLAAAPATRDTLGDGFRTPPDSAKTWCNWTWLDSNATKEGITRDLEEMKCQGIAGALVYDAAWGTPRSRITTSRRSARCSWGPSGGKRVVLRTTLGGSSAGRRMRSDCPH